MHHSLRDSFLTAVRRHVLGGPPGSGAGMLTVVDFDGLVAAGGPGGEDPFLGSLEVDFTVAGDASGDGAPATAHLPDAAFGLVVAGDALAHSVDPAGTWLEMVRLCAPEGVIVVVASSTSACWSVGAGGLRALTDSGGVHLVDTWVDPRGPHHYRVAVFRPGSAPEEPAEEAVGVPPVLPAAHQALQNDWPTDAPPEVEQGRGTEFYLGLYERVHKWLAPRNYLEIGVSTGQSLRLASCDAIGIDPDPHLDAPVAGNHELLEHTSDDVFAFTDIVASAGPFDLAFIDGMHLIENVLMDFMNVERNCHPASLIMIDDPCPAHPMQARRTRATQFWTGDVWKIIPILRRWRPDLLLVLVDTDPTGTLLVLGADPDNTTLWDNYDTILEAAVGDDAVVDDDIVSRVGALDPGDSIIARLLTMVASARQSPDPAEAMRGVRQVVEGAMASGDGAMKAPLLSVVVVTYNMNRELPRTLASLAPGYQRGIAADEYEVIVVDNGSAVPPELGDFTHLGIDLTILTTPGATPSPAPAVNRGLNAAAGSAIGVLIDGARMASPGLLATARDALSMSPRAVVGTRGRYLGYQTQRDAIAEGYDHRVEDALLESVDWAADGYRLFAISVFDESSGPTWFDAMAESNSLFMWRDLWVELGGYDTAFISPGGGLVNLDAWVRARALPEALPIALVGEATFHQVHGGVATNGSQEALDAMFAEYAELRGAPFETPTSPLAMWGSFVDDPPVDELRVLPQPLATTWKGQVRTRVGLPLAAWLPTPVVRRLRSGYERVVPVITGSRSDAAAARRAEDYDAALVSGSGLFDPAWYVERYPEVAEGGWDPVRHYLRYGVSEGRQPGPHFDGLWYAMRNTDVAKAGMNPLVHYLRFGIGEGRWTRVVDPTVGHTQRDDLAESVEEVAASSLFDAEWYMRTYRDVATSGLEPPVHYVRLGALRGYNPGPGFDANRYLNDNPDVRLAGVNPLLHYLASGAGEGREIYPVGGEK